MKLKKSILVGLIGLLIFTAIIFKHMNNYNLVVLDTNVKTVTIQDYPIALELETLVVESDVIVVGHFEDFIESWNMARNPKDISKSDDKMYVEGRLFSFVVDEYLKGEGDENIRVNLRYKYQDIVDEMYIEPIPNEKIMLFLSKDKVFNNYYGTMQPFTFRVVEDTLEVKTNLKAVEDEFKKNKITILDVIEKISVIEKTF